MATVFVDELNSLDAVFAQAVALEQKELSRRFGQPNFHAIREGWAAVGRKADEVQTAIKVAGQEGGEDSLYVQAIGHRARDKFAGY